MAKTHAFKVTPKRYCELKDLLKWYDAMPKGLELGEGFHEDIMERIDELMPEILPDDEAHMTMFVDTPYIKRTCVYADVMNTETNEKVFTAKIVWK